MEAQSEVTMRLGGFGTYQRRLTVILSFTNVIMSSFTMVTLFVSYVPDHRCWIKDLEELNSVFEVGTTSGNSSANSTFSLIHNYIPLETDQAEQYLWDRCGRFNNTTSSLLNQSIRSTIPCNDGWSYNVEKGEVSAVMEFDLVCDLSWTVPLTQSMLLVGLMIGSILGGYLSDRYGRKKTLVISGILLAIFALGMAWTPVAVGVHIGMLVIGMSTIMRASSCVVFINESTPIKYGKKLSLVVIFCATLGNIIMPMIAFLIPNWRWMLTVMALEVVILLPFILFFVEESAIWTLQAKSPEQAKKLMKKLARINGVEIENVEALTALSDSNQQESKSPTDEVENESEAEVTTKLSYFDLFKEPFLRRRLIILSISLFAVSMAYYGLYLNANRLAGNRYINCFLSALVEVPCYAICFFLVRRVGCRRIYVVATFACGVCMLVTPIFKSVNEFSETICAMIGKFFIAASFVVVYLFTGDFFPTLLRNQAYGASSFFARIGGIIVPYLLYLGEIIHFSVPYLVMGVTCIIAACAVYFLPETNGLELPVTLEDAREQEKNRPTFNCRKGTKEDRNENTESRLAKDCVNV